MQPQVVWFRWQDFASRLTVVILVIVVCSFIEQSRRQQCFLPAQQVDAKAVVCHVLFNKV